VRGSRGSRDGEGDKSVGAEDAAAGWSSDFNGDGREAGGVCRRRSSEEQQQEEESGEEEKRRSTFTVGV